MELYDGYRAERLLGRSGSAIVFVARMLPSVRTIISIPAGLLKMGMARFFLWSAAGTAVWSSALAIAGYFLGSPFKEIERIIGPLSTAVILMIVVIYIWLPLTWRRGLQLEGG